MAWCHHHHRYTAFGSVAALSGPILIFMRQKECYAAMTGVNDKPTLTAEDRAWVEGRRKSGADADATKKNKKQ